MELEVTETLVVGMLVIASLVAIAVSFLRLPYTIALVIVGLVLGIGDVFTDFSLTSDVILFAFLPPLLFEGSISMDLEDLRRRWRQVGTLAFAGTAVAVALLVLPLHFLVGLDWPFAIVLGVMLAPTDPVSVLAIFKEHGVGTGLRTLLEGESIFNDALAIVLFIIASEAAFGGHVTWQDGVFEFVREVAIGAAAGILVGYAAHQLMRLLDDHLVEITLSLVTAFGAFLLADNFHGSGVIATVTAGLLIGNYGTTLAMSASSRVALTEFWEVIAYLANSLLFLLMGLQVVIDDLLSTQTAIAIGVSVVAMLAGRLAIAYGLLQPFTRDRAQATVPRAWQHAVFWGGLRGAIPVALVLGLEDSRFGEIDALAVVVGVVLFSLLVQGLTYKPLLERLGLIGSSDELLEYEERYARVLVLRASVDELDSLQRRAALTGPMYRELHNEFERDLEQAQRELDQATFDTESVRHRQIQRTARRLAAAQRAALTDAARRGLISERVADEYGERIEHALEDGAVAPGLGADYEPGLYVDDDVPPEA